MAGSMKYFVFNKESDFQRGLCKNLRITSRGICIRDPQAEPSALFFSRLLDSREKETQWHRILVAAKSIGDASLRFRIYASESRTLEWEGKTLDLEDFLKEETLSQAEKERMIKDSFVKEVYNPEDVLLHEAKGRYLWFSIELFGQGEESPEIFHIKIFFPKQTWIEYLPEIYQNDPRGKSFVERYLGIFQSLYDDLSTKIEKAAAHFDPDSAERDFLEWLAGWIGIDDGYLWTQEQLRYLLKNSMRLYKIRGTRKALSEMIRIYTGETPYIIEQYQLECSMGDAGRADLMKRLYGDSSYFFTVILSEKSVPTQQEYKTLLKIIENGKPAHVEANTVVLKPYIFLDRHSYLGMNSVLSQYRPVSLDGFSALPFTSVTREKRRDVAL